MTSAILPVEVRSALRRRTSEGTLDAIRVPEMLRRVATLVEVGSEVPAAAGTLIAAHPLRTLAAIHVATAQLFRSRGRRRSSSS